MDIQYTVNDQTLTPQQFLDLVQRVWPGEFELEKTAQALAKTINITARYNGYLIGCVRILTDGYLFGTIPEILVDPQYQKQGIGRRLMELSWDESPTSLFFGAQPGNEEFFEKLDYQKSMQSYVKRKPRK